MAQDCYQTLLEGGSGEIEEKKSRFIANIRPVHSEEEAVSFIDEMKKKYWDARHNCSAFVIGSRGELSRCSDDGEPAGTAGRPMLEVLLGSEIRNICVVVTRYFGGTLLGTGGLVRAYSQAVKEGLADCKVGKMCYGRQILLTTDYNDIGKILYLLGQKGISAMDSIYEADVRLRLQVTMEEDAMLDKEVTEVTAGRCRREVEEELWFLRQV